MNFIDHAITRAGRNTEDAARATSSKSKFSDQSDRESQSLESLLADASHSLIEQSRTSALGPLAHMAATVCKVSGAVGIVILVFAGALFWLPNATSNTPDEAPTSKSKPDPAASTVATTSVQPPDNERGVAPNPLTPIVIRRSTPPDEQTSASRTEIAPPWIAVPETVDPLTTPQLLDLREIEHVKRVQQRLIDLGFLFGAADGIWGSRSRRALQDFRVSNGIGEGDSWDEATQQRLLTASDAIGTDTSDITFIGGWGTDVAQCRKVSAHNHRAPCRGFRRRM